MPRLHFNMFLVYGADLPAVVYVGVEPMPWRKVVKALGKAVRQLTGKAPGWKYGRTHICGTNEKLDDPRYAFSVEWARIKYHCIYIRADETFEIKVPKHEVS